MIAVASKARFLGRLFLLALAFAFLTLAQDGPRAAADHSEIIIANSADTPFFLSSMFFAPGGTARTVYVRASNITHDGSGVAAFDVVLEFNPNIATITSILPDPASWLNSTGRPVSCSDPTDPTNPGIRPIDPENPDGLWEAWVSCITIATSPPGPTGSGLLATFVVEPASSFGGFSLKNKSAVYNTTGNADEIAVTKRSTTVFAVHCADVVPEGGDGVVSGGDITEVVRNFGLTKNGPNWNPVPDLNKDAVITGADITLVVLQFGLTCPF